MRRLAALLAILLLATAPSGAAAQAALPTIFGAGAAGAGQQGGVHVR
jgi:hypothetical protein